MKVILGNIFYVLLVVLIGALFTLTMNVLISLENTSTLELISFLSRLFGLLIVLLISRSFIVTVEVFKENFTKISLIWILLSTLGYVTLGIGISEYFKIEFFITDRNISALNVLDYFLLIPFLEEVLFRGVIQKKFENRFHWFLAIIFTALLFPLVHFNLSFFIFYFSFSLISGLLYYKFKAIHVSILFHILVNILVSVAVVIV